MILLRLDAGKIVHVPEWESVGAKRDREGSSLPAGSDPKIPVTYVAEFREDGMSPKFAEADIDWFKKSDIELRFLPSLDQRNALLRDFQVAPDAPTGAVAYIAEMNVAEDEDD